VNDSGLRLTTTSSGKYRGLIAHPTITPIISSLEFQHIHNINPADQRNRIKGDPLKGSCIRIEKERGRVVEVRRV
jgi:hypothetical protein